MPRLELGTYVEEFVLWLLQAVPGLLDGISAVVSVVVDSPAAVVVSSLFEPKVPVTTRTAATTPTTVNRYPMTRAVIATGRPCWWLRRISEREK